MVSGCSWRVKSFLVSREDGRPLLRRHEAQRDRHSVNAVTEILLVAPELLDARVHHGYVLQADDVQPIDHIGDPQVLELGHQRFVFRLRVLLPRQVLF
jgi:hypothetical protein